VAGVGVGDLKDFLFFCLGTVWSRLRIVKNRIFRLEIEARRNDPHLERKNRSDVEEW